MATTARQDVVTGLLSVLSAYRAANPTLLRKVFPRKPGGFAELPAAYVGDLDETILHTSGTRQRTFVGATVVIVDTFSDKEDGPDRLDQLVDGLVDAFTAAPSAIAGAVLEMTAVASGELPVTSRDGQTVNYRASTLQFGRITIMEGRL